MAALEKQKGKLNAKEKQKLREIVDGLDSKDEQERAKAAEALDEMLLKSKGKQLAILAQLRVLRDTLTPKARWQLQSVLKPWVDAMKRIFGSE